MNRFDLEGRTAIVTGAAQGVGLSIAERLAASGAHVTCWDVDAERLGSVGDRFGRDVVDVRDWGAIEAAVERLVAKRGDPQILVNNAGITGPNATTWDYPIGDWSRVLDVNLTGTFLVCRAVIPRMIARDHGRIVNIASVAGKDGNPNAPAYSASKAGVIALTKSLGKELAGTPITVNCVTPAVMKTAIFEQMLPEHIDYMLSKIPMGRFGRTEELASLVAWLCSEECSFSTGAVFDFSGGRSTY